MKKAISSIADLYFFESVLFLLMLSYQVYNDVVYEVQVLSLRQLL